MFGYTTVFEMYCFALFLIQSYCMASEDLEYCTQDIWTNFMVLFFPFHVPQKTESHLG